MSETEKDKLIKELTVALESLYDNQNGPPLPKYEKSWHEAMELAEKALEKAR